VADRAVDGAGRADMSAGTSSAGAAADEWPREALRAFERVRAADEATRQLFTESDSGAIDLASTARTLRVSTRAARALAQSLIDTLGRDASPDAAAGASQR
jgi:hypothetical protein